MESVIVQVVSDALFTDYKFNYRYKLLTREEDNRPRRGELLRLENWQYDPSTTEFLVRSYQNLSGGGNIPTFPERPIWQLNEAEVDRKECSFRVLVSPKRPFRNLNKQPVNYESLERLLVNEVECTRSKIVDLTL